MPSSHPYPFPSYPLTVLDHVVPHVHFFASLTFHLNDTSQSSISHLNTAIHRLVSHYPFLSGKVTPIASKHEDEKESENQFQLEPSTATDLQCLPLLSAETHHYDNLHHPSCTSSSSFISCPCALTLPNGHLNPRFLPFESSLLSASTSSPALRFKANFIDNTRSLILVYGFDHRVLDGIGMQTVLASLAIICRCLSRPDEGINCVLPTTAGKQVLARAYIDGLVLGPSQEGQETQKSSLPWRTKSSSKSNSNSKSSSRSSHTHPVSTLFSISTKKLALLRLQCQASLRRRNRTLEPLPLSSNMVLTALIGFCAGRARRCANANYHCERIHPQEEEEQEQEQEQEQKQEQKEKEKQDQSKIILTAVDIRTLARIPGPYLGNAVIALESDATTAHVNANPTATPNSNANSSPDSNAIPSLALQALSLTQTLHSLTSPAKIHSLLSTMGHLRDWGPSLQPCYGSKNGIMVGNMRAAQGYYEDYGRLLGRVRTFDVPVDGEGVGGFCWILPQVPDQDQDGGEDGRAGKETIKVRVVLEREAVEVLRRDELWKWMTTIAGESHERTRTAVARL